MLSARQGSQLNHKAGEDGIVFPNKIKEVTAGMLLGDFNCISKVAYGQWKR
jgi:hypothetical protein